MEILILGGTRFLGRKVVEGLLQLGHRVTVISRRANQAPLGVEAISSEREQGLSILSGRSFDLTLDFICYRGSHVGQVLSALKPGVYIFVSTTWLPRIHDNNSMLLDVTKTYLNGKLEAEKAVKTYSMAGGASVILRLPIMWGQGDHTLRLDFYRRRMRNGGPVIAVDAGANVAQVAWHEDIASRIIEWAPSLTRSSDLYWDALPNEGFRVCEIIRQIALVEGVNPALVEIGRDDLTSGLPGYLVEEPLWRETPSPITSNNLFMRSGYKPTAMGNWLKTLINAPIGNVNEALLARERVYLAGRGYA